MKDTKILLFVLVAYLPVNSYADWFCKEASSQAIDNIFYACGHGSHKSLSGAREMALQSAKREFNEFCKESANCKNNAYTISPLRTDCSQVDDKFSCYRGLEYRILPEKRSSVKIDKKQIAGLIKEREKELEALEDELEQARKLSELNNRIAELKNIDSKEADIEHLKHIKSDYAPAVEQLVGIKLGGVGTPLKENSTDDSESVALSALGIEYETIFWKNLGIRFSASFIFGPSETELKDRGDANSSSVKENYGHSGFDGNISLPIHIGSFTISPTFGVLAVSYKTVQYNYNDYGIGLDKKEAKESYNSAYFGMGLRYGKTFFLDVEPRQYLKDGKASSAIYLGFSAGF